jgi:hypothetical protein
MAKQPERQGAAQVAKHHRRNRQRVHTLRYGTTDADHYSVALEGSAQICRYLARAFAPQCYGKDAVTSSSVDFWLDFANDSIVGAGADFKKLNVALSELNRHLKMRSFMVGYSWTLADLIVWGALRCTILFCYIDGSLGDLASRGQGQGRAGVFGALVHVHVVPAVCGGRTSAVVGRAKKDGGAEEG